MNTEVLRRYFEKASSAEEVVAVEQWLLEPGSREVFNRFLETYWEEHLEGTSEAVEQKTARPGTIRRFVTKAAAAAAVIAVLLLAADRFFSGEKNALPADTAIARVVKEPKPAYGNVVPEAAPGAGALTEKHNAPSKAVRHERKRIPEHTTTAPVAQNRVKNDTAGQGAGQPKSVKMTRFSKVMINEVALSKLDRSEQFEVLNQMALRVNIDNASFEEVAALLREKFGVVMELCAAGEAKGSNVRPKNYSASFSEVTLSELINDMSKQMAFSYTFADNHTVKVCFN